METRKCGLSKREVFRVRWEEHEHDDVAVVDWGAYVVAIHRSQERDGSSYGFTARQLPNWRIALEYDQ